MFSKDSGEATPHDKLDTMERVRLFVDGQDYGTMSRRAAEMYQQVNEDFKKGQTLRIEPVDAEAPVFLAPAGEK
jgi:hypothetical protein